jgi:hypothetical protein
MPCCEVHSSPWLEVRKSIAATWRGTYSECSMHDADPLQPTEPSRIRPSSPRSITGKLPWLLPLALPSASPSLSRLVPKHQNDAPLM